MSILSKHSFVGTYQEFIDYLKVNNFWKDKEEYEKFLSKPSTQIELSNFSNYNSDIEKGVIFYSGIAYLENNKPTYPDRVIFNLSAQGYSQKEINHAFGKALDELEKMRDKNKEGIKDFILTKHKGE